MSEKHPSELPPLPSEDDINDASLEQIKQWGLAQNYRVERHNDKWRVGEAPWFETEIGDDIDLTVIVDTEAEAWEVVRNHLLQERETLDWVKANFKKPSPKH